MREINYRPDLDGLRGIAVLLVVAFHAWPQLLPFGYLGVDIFFVISGFLITAIIQSEWERGAFSFAGFYLRRVQRLAPSLLIVLLATSLVAWATLYPHELRQLLRRS